LRHPEDPDTQTGTTTVTLPISATCPSNINFYAYGQADYMSDGEIGLVYSTGLIDDYGTPNDTSDDQPELEVLTVPVRLQCTAPPTALFEVYVEDLTRLQGEDFSGQVYVINYGTASGSLTVIPDSDASLQIFGSVTLAPGEGATLNYSGRCPTGLNNPYYGYALTLHGGFSTTNSGLLQAQVRNSGVVTCLDHRGLPGVRIPYFSYGYGTQGLGMPFYVANNGGGSLGYELLVSISSPDHKPVGIKPYLTSVGTAARFSQSQYFITNLPTLSPNSENEGATFIADFLCLEDQNVVVTIVATGLGESSNLSSTKELYLRCNASVQNQVGW
jgi:hypothetical protein